MPNYCRNCVNCVPSFKDYSDATTLKDDTHFVCTKMSLYTNPYTTDYNAGCTEHKWFEERADKNLSEVEKLAYDLMLSNPGRAEKLEFYKRYIALGLRGNFED